MQFHVYQPPEPEPEIYLSDSGLPEELWRSVDIALLAAETDEPILFGGDDWGSWLGGEFNDLIAPHLVDARNTAAGGVAIRELAELDAKLDHELQKSAAEGRERSIGAGLKLLDRNDGAKRVEPIAKLKRCIDSGDCAGHAATVFALQCALFNLPVAATLTSYLCLEWKAASDQSDWRDQFEKQNPTLTASMPGWLQSGAAANPFAEANFPG